MKKIIILSGAGISAESGISTYRDSGGLWEKYSIEEVASIDGYKRNPQLVLEFYNERRKQYKNTQPNLAHRLCHELEGRYEVVVITQNVDNLHEKAGSTNIIHLHGECDKACSSYNPNDSRYIVELTDDHPDIHIGDKAGDGSQLRPYIVWFGEAVPKMEDAIDAVQDADIFIIIGTSLNVYPAAGLVSYVPKSAKVFIIDPNDINLRVGTQITHIKKKATEGMKELVELLEKQKTE